MELVKLGRGDYPRIRTLWQRAGLDIRPSGRDSEEALARQMEGGVQTALGMEEKGDLVGVVIVTHDSRKGWINRLAVEPGCRRRGIGSTLIAAAETHLQMKGIEVIGALVHQENRVSIAVLNQAGYESYPGVLYLSKRPNQDA